MKIKFVDIPVGKDPRGNIAVLENISVPFKIKRVYYLFDVPSGGTRGGLSLIHISEPTRH